MKRILIVLFECFLIALFYLIFTGTTLYFGAFGLYFYTPLGQQDKMNTFYETWFQIPSTGADTDSLALFLKTTRFSSFKNENEYGFGNVDDSCRTREDTYVVFNYHSKDDLFLIRYIDSLMIDTAMNRHTLNFHLYLPTVEFNRTRYWKLEYEKITFDTLYNQDKEVVLTHAVNKKLIYTRFPEFSKDYRHGKQEVHGLVYDEKFKKFRFPKDYQNYYFRKKTGEWSKYFVTFYK